MSLRGACGADVPSAGAHSMPTHRSMLWSRRVALTSLLLGPSAGCERTTVPPPSAAASSPRLMTPQA